MKRPKRPCWPASRLMSRLLFSLSVSRWSCGHVVSTVGQVCHQHRTGQQLYRLGQNNGFNGVVRNKRPEPRAADMSNLWAEDFKCQVLNQDDSQPLRRHVRLCRTQVPMIQEWLIVTHLVEQAWRDKYHRLESLRQRGAAEADGAFLFSVLIGAINAAFSCKCEL